MNNRSVITLSTSALEHNLAQYKKVIKNKLLGVVVKSNAYGHGLIEIGSLLQKNPLVDWLFVASLSEAIELRKNGITKPILVMYHLDDCVDFLITYDIATMVTDLETLKKLDQCGIKLGSKIKIHLKIDTGLSRFGFDVCQSLSVCITANSLAGINLEGIYSHLAESAKDSLFTHTQIEQFDRVIKELEEHNITIPYKHIANTAAMTTCQLTTTNLVRLGLGAYGIWPSDFNKRITQAIYPDFELQPVLTWKSKIEFIRGVKKGDTVGYDRTYQAVQPCTIAVVPIGYFDGYDRRLGNKALVIVKGIAVPVVGRVAMTTMMIDVTGLSVKIGDEVVLIGKQSPVHATCVSEIMQSYNPRELLTRLHERIKRVIEQ